MKTKNYYLCVKIYIIYPPEVLLYTDVPLQDSFVFRVSCSNVSWLLVG